MNVRVGNQSVRLSARRLLDQGGEAEVYSLGRDRVLKVFKQPDHADYASDPDKVAAARARLEEHQRKLSAFPDNLPATVIAPLELATDPRTGRVVGYAMERVRDAETLYKLGDARERRSRGLASLTASLLSLHDTVTTLHARDVVIGDFNDLNVLVKADRAYVIDADSFQFGAFGCNVFCERFVDPRLCDPRTGLSPVRPFDPDSDWYAFAVMTARTLLSVGPYGGIHTPAGSSRRVPTARRPLERLSIFNAPIRLPRPSLPPEVLSDDLRAHLHGVFADDRRAPMPRRLLESLAWSQCASCGLDHSRQRCPRCAPRAIPVRTAPVSASRMLDPARATALRRRASDAIAGGNTDEVWIDGRRLLRRGRFGPEHIGDVMSTSTRFWTSDTFGFGFYAAGRLQFGFVFDRKRGGLDDQVPLLPIRGVLADAHAALSNTHAWLLTREKRGPSMHCRVTVVSRRGERVATLEGNDVAWTAGFRGACAIGAALFVPTDDGVVRVEVSGSTLVLGKRFPDTAPHVDVATTLLADASSLVAIGPRTVTVLRSS